MRWQCRDRTFDLQDRVLVMGVLNVTPDSFSDGGRFLAPDAAIAHGRSLIEQGADLIDVGAESTRPGASPVPADEQWRRLDPVLKAFAHDPSACVSIDTTHADVAARGLDAGARVINDVSALADPAMADRVAQAGAGVVLMHMQGTPADMQHDPRYHDAPTEIAAWLRERWRTRLANVPEACVALDPGIGFGKTLEHNLAILARLDEIAALGRPIVVGVSRKSFLGRVLDLPVEERLEAGLGASAVAVFQGASILRTHDVVATRRAVTIAAAIRAQRSRSTKIG